MSSENNEICATGIGILLLIIITCGLIHGCLNEGVYKPTADQRAIAEKATK